MRTKLDLKIIANQIAEKSGGSCRNMKKFEGSVDEYFISDVTEEMLKELGFVFKGYTSYGVAPYYEKDNIMCYFDDVVLHVMEMTYSVFEKETENKDDEENKDEENTESEENTETEAIE